MKELHRSPWKLHREVSGELAEIGPPAIPPLAKALGHSKDWVRQRAVATLEKMNHPAAIPPLAKALQDSDSVVRSSAAWALGKIGRSIQGKEVEGKEAKAFQLVATHFRKEEAPEVILKSYRAALEGKITKQNARLFVKELRAVKGSLK